MNELYGLSRVLVVFFGLTTLLGVVWFANSLGETVVIVGIIMGLSSLGAAFVSFRMLTSGATRRVLITLCAIGIGAGFILIANDLGASRGIEWDVVAIRLLHIVALATMAIKQETKIPESN